MKDSDGPSSDADAGRFRAMLRRGRRPLLVAVGVAALTFAYFWYPPAVPDLVFPEGKRFAFTIVDDADGGTVETVGAVYEFLHELGVRTTKTVWTLPSVNLEEWPNRGESLADPHYRDFVHRLQGLGFEIASHGARGGSSPREEVLRGMEEYRAVIGEYPRIHINHFQNRDNLYWGEDRLLVAPVRWVYELLADPVEFDGEEEGSDYYWGDFAREHIDYVVNLTFTDIDLFEVDPIMPYREPRQPVVNYWFHTADGGVVDSFVELLQPRNLDRLEENGGVTIVYTHLGSGFYRDGELHEGFESVMRDLAARDGWFVPAGELLDYLRDRPGRRDTHTFRERVRLELRWILQKLMVGPS